MSYPTNGATHDIDVRGRDQFIVDVQKVTLLPNKE